MLGLQRSVLPVAGDPALGGQSSIGVSIQQGFVGDRQCFCGEALAWGNHLLDELPLESTAAAMFSNQFEIKELA